MMRAARAGRLRSQEPSPAEQIALLPQPGRDVDPPSCVLVAGVDDTLAARQSLPSGLVRFSADLGIRYLAGGELEAARVTPSFWISPVPTGASDRRALFETITNEVVEQDASGRLWIDDDLVAPGALLAFGSPTRLLEGQLILGERAAMLVGYRQARGWALSVVTTKAVVWIFDQPLPASAPRLHGWLRLAARDGDGRTA